MNLFKKISPQIMYGDTLSSQHDPHPNYLVAKKGLMSWLLTVDHKRIGIMYLISIALFS